MRSENIFPTLGNATIAKSSITALKHAEQKKENAADVEKRDMQGHPVQTPLTALIVMELTKRLTETALITK